MAAKVIGSKLRNIGIVAHINAGKTTTTERILFHAGSTNTVGDVDKGNTVTDYLVQERDRGITITSAAVTYNWKKHRINLIDTPGHVDFTIEVERSLSVLDGAVTIIDASAGVEAQTVTVWNQALKYNLPNVIFLNKIDKPQANYKMCLEDLKNDLNMNAGLIQLPVKQAQNKFESIIDIVNQRLICWNNPSQDNGANFSDEPSTVDTAAKHKLDTKLINQMHEERERLVNILSDCDEKFASHVIECDRMADVSGLEIAQAIRASTLATKFSPVLVGSSFKYIGVQQLMDAINAYLPSPPEREERLGKLLDLTVGQSKDPCAFLFKILHDKRLGALNYVRLYSGEIKRQQRLTNLETGKSEQIKQIFRAFADELREIDTPVGKGDIVVLTGLLESKTGDILVNTTSSGTQMAQQTVGDASSKQTIKLIEGKFLVPNINKMEPVYYCNIESPSSAQQIRLEQALACLSREDPSFTYEIDALGVGTIRGMGKLHLEIARDRIKSEYGVEAILGPMQISYRETIDGSAVEELQVDRMINSIKSNLAIKLYVRAKPEAGAWTSKLLRLNNSGESSLNKLRLDHRKAIESGLTAAMLHGPALGYPVIDCDILLLDFRANHRCSLPLIASTAAQCLSQALGRCAPRLLEPIMLLEIVAPRAHNGPIVHDLTSTRRGLVLSSQARQENDTLVIRAQAPLATLADYAEHLRILTSGRGSFSMELSNYRAVSEAERRNIVRI